MDLLEKLVLDAHNVFNGQPWYGISVIQKIERIDYPIVNEKPFNTSHSIAELIGHMINWKNFVIEKIKGNQSFDIEVDSAMDWPAIVVNNKTEWEALIQKLKEKHAELISTIQQDPHLDLSRKVKGRTYDLQFLIDGIIQHDIYHLGQIAMLHKQLVQAPS